MQELKEEYLKRVSGAGDISLGPVTEIVVDSVQVITVCEISTLPVKLPPDVLSSNPGIEIERPVYVFPQGYTPPWCVLAK